MTRRCTLSEKTDQIIKELGYEPAKSKKPQPKTQYTPQGRDAFQTPNYAVDLLVPFIPKGTNWIWEPACGDGKISTRLREHKYNVYATDLLSGMDFLSWEPDFIYKIDCIITNPPFSLKIDFFEKCLEYDTPFALLIPADYTGWNITACKSLGCEKIIPTRRIDYITPQGFSGATGHTADFHSMWLTWGFGLGKTETFVELSLEEKKGNI